MAPGPIDNGWTLHVCKVPAVKNVVVKSLKKAFAIDELKTNYKFTLTELTFSYKFLYTYIGNSLRYFATQY